MEKQIKILEFIIADCDKDIKEYEHAPFTGKTVGELHGIMEAKIQALARIMKENLEHQVWLEETLGKLI